MEFIDYYKILDIDKKSSEDDIKKAEDNVQTITNESIAKIDQLVAKKEIEIMTV